MGKTGEHLTFKLESGVSAIKTLYWRGSRYNRVFQNPSNTFDIVFSPEVNEYNNKVSIQIVLEDWKNKTADRSKRKRIYPENPSIPLKIIDSRGMDKISYIEKILKRKESVIFYVRDKKTERFLMKTFKSKFPDYLKTYDYEEDNKGLLSDLENNKFIGLVTKDHFEKQENYPFVKHHIFCHPELNWERFYDKCLPAINSNEISGIHLLYNTLDKNYLTEQASNDISNSKKSKFLRLNLQSFLDFQYQKDIKLIWERIYDESTGATNA